MNSKPHSNIILDVNIREEKDRFSRRHIGPRASEIEEMLALLGLSSLEELIDSAVPTNIRTRTPLRLGEPLSEHEMLQEARKLAVSNHNFRSFIGMGYSETITPPVIQRNILENPGWYTQYTPYQAEIAQGRLEALLNFQTMIIDLTGLEIANASLLDEASAAAEAMGLSLAASKGRDQLRYFASERCHPQTIDVIKTRAEGYGVDIVVGDHETVDLAEGYFGALLQYPASDGAIINYRPFCERARQEGVLVTVAADLLALALLTPPGEWGADVVVGSSQRFGVPLAYGGPHAAYFATRNEYSRLIPGRIVGVSRDSQGEPALRLALQTREQHIRRDRATSNICTAQVLLAIMASMYTVYHGPEGIRRIAGNIFRHTRALVSGINRLGLPISTSSVFDTIKVQVPSQKEALRRSTEKKMNFRIYQDGDIGISLGEPVSCRDIEEILLVLSGRDSLAFSLDDLYETADLEIESSLRRTTPFMEHPVFHSHRSETQLLRYIHNLQQGDLSLTTSMIPLGSCTMKLNATAEMIPITWSSFSDIHPFVPKDQVKGYQTLIRELERMLGEITGMSAVSLQPNAGSQGEYAGLMAIRAYHKSRVQGHRNICLIPTSAHGTNPASAVMAGMKVVTVRCDDNGNIDVTDLRHKAEKNQEELAAIMVTYPSTHGVFEESISTICNIVHQHGGQVYMDGANLNALVGICRPREFGVDVCHLNLHKTFCIPHGGGGPGVGPIAVAEHLAGFLPGHFDFAGAASHAGPVASAPWGSAGILPISWAYLKMMGSRDLTRASEVAILNANYVARKLEDHYPVLYRGKNGMVAHECILDCRRFRKAAGISVSDIAKRLMDYGFHAPTISWPVVETMMIEPTESESREELDRFCEAMICIRQEIDEIETGIAHRDNNALKNAPHTAEMVCSDRWDHPYTREKAAFPVPRLRKHKFWPAVSRVDDAYGDRNLFCACVPVESFVEAADGAAGS